MIFSKKKIITHDGSFHTDDIFACAALSMLLDNRGEKFEIIRTRDDEIIKKGDYVLDVGGFYDPSMNRFDHHQFGGAGKRSNGVEYSSFGLLWEKWGEDLAGSKEVKEQVEKRLVMPIDAGDNGMDLVEAKHEVFPYFIQNMFVSMQPTWKEDEGETDEIFLRCVEIAKSVLMREITQARDGLEAKSAVIQAYENTPDKRIIILDKKYPFSETFQNFPEPLFVVFPRPSDGFWAVKAVREDRRSFKNRKNLPNIWGGLRDQQLQNVTGVTDAVFCHRALFLAVAKSKEGAVELAKKALV